MRWASARAAGLALLGLAPGGCGLLSSSPDPPHLEAVYVARRLQISEWELLEQATALYLAEGSGALDALRQLTAKHPGVLRLAAMVQDVELEFEGADQVWNRYVQLYGRDSGPRNAYLAARVAPSRGTSFDLVNAALEQDPDFIAARVLRIGLQSRIGNPRYLDELVELLEEHPGSAEGWRLLANLAPLYGRGDLARLAAETEPWSPLEDARRARLLRAATALDDGDPVGALAALADHDESDRDARLLLASAWLKGGNLEQARKVLDELAADHPDDPHVQFNLGLLAMDYLNQKELAAEHFRNFLAMVEAGASVPYLRTLQAELWLEWLEPGSAKKPILLGEELDFEAVPVDAE